MPVLNFQPPTPHDSQDENIPTTPMPSDADADATPMAGPSASQLKPPSIGPMTRSRSQSSTPPSLSIGKRKTEDSGAGQAWKHQK